jgi:hypothetical protein
MIFTEDEVLKKYEANKKVARDKLKEIEVYCKTKDPDFKALHGWVFEQTIQHCLRKELEARDVPSDFKEQEPFGSRARADLKIGKVCIEIKLKGLFSPTASEKYERYKKAAQEEDLQYVFVTGQETSEPYKKAISEKLGPENTFFLNENGAWAKFVDRLVKLLKPDIAQTQGSAPKG